MPAHHRKTLVGCRRCHHERFAEDNWLWIDDGPGSGSASSCGTSAAPSGARGHLRPRQPSPRSHRCGSPCPSSGSRTAPRTSSPPTRPRIPGGRGARRRPGGAFPGAPCALARRCRRLSLPQHARRADDDREADHRRLRDRGGRRRGPRCRDAQGADRSLPGSRQARGDVRGRAVGRPRGNGARHRSGRDPLAELHHTRALPAHGPRLHVRLWRLPGGTRPGLRRVRVRRTAARANAGTDRWPARRPWPVGVHRARGRPVRFGSAEVEPDGSVVVRTGSTSHGQGHETTFAQIATGVFGIETARVRVESGDTASVPDGVGSFASRSVAVGGPRSSSRHALLGRRRRGLLPGCWRVRGRRRLARRPGDRPRRCGLPR
jgi:Molybdopterin-binding domain of aldehyde dehydrogenase